MLSSVDLSRPGAVEGVYVALDIEATGMDPAVHEIIEVALVVFDRERIIDQYATVVRPRGRLSLDIAALTGLSTAELSEAPPFGDIASTVRRHLAGRPIVGQSVWMDLAMLEAAGLVLPNPVYDTYQLATLLLPDLPAYNLVSIARQLGIPLAAGHRALADATVTAQVFQGLLQRLDEYDGDTLSQVAQLAQIAEWPVAQLLRGVAERHPTGPLFDTAAAPARRAPQELAFLTPRERPEPLRRTGSTKPIDPATVRRALGGDGPLGTVIPGYEERPQQQAMAQAVAEAFNHDGQLLVEAGTGTGKSIAYLLPSILHAAERGETVVLSTNTLALQDQLYRKDVPDLRAALGDHPRADDLTATVLKGRSNYLCLRRWFAHQKQPLLDPADAQVRAKVLLWLGETETGDRAELRLDREEEAVWRGLSAEEDACIAARCIYQQRNQCFLYRARRAAEHAHLVIVNHALLLSDVVAGSRVIPEYDHLVVDEAHHLEDQATSHFGFRVDQRTIEDHLNGILRSEGALQAGTIATVASFLARSEDEAAKQQAPAAVERARQMLEQVSRARQATTELFGQLAGWVSRGGDGGYERTLRITGSVRRDSDWLEVELIWERLDRHLRELDEGLTWFLETVERISVPDGGDALDALQHEELTIELGAALRAGADLAVQLQSVIGAPAADAVYWIERSPIADYVSLHAAPLHVDELLRERLFDPLRSVVLTSATITTDGTFDYVAGRLGLPDADRLALPSPFDYERSTLLYLADDIPEPNMPGYQRRLQEGLIDACEATGGRALVLFTSHAALQATYRAIKRPLEDRGIIVLAQRTDGSPRQLIERLRHSPNVVVLGTATFWEGVDVVGPALSLLVITKLPFAVPSDPVFAARSELLEQPFLDYAVPQAVLRFKQGFGRLIRSSQDRGVCAILDRRVLSKRYGASFVQSLPECSITIGGLDDLPATAAEWLEAEVELASLVGAGGDGA